MKLTPAAIDSRRGRAAELQRQIIAREETINRLSNQVAAEKKRLKEAHETLTGLVFEIISGETDDEQLSLDEAPAPEDDGPGLSAQDRADLDTSAEEAVAEQLADLRETVRSMVLAIIDEQHEVSEIALVVRTRQRVEAAGEKTPTEALVFDVLRTLVKAGGLAVEEREQGDCKVKFYRRPFRPQQVAPAPKAKPAARARKGRAL